MSIWFISSIGNFCYVAIDTVWAVDLEQYSCQNELKSISEDSKNSQNSVQICQINKLELTKYKWQHFNVSELVLIEQALQIQPSVKSNILVQEDTPNSQLQFESPQLEVQREDFLESPSIPTEKLNQTQNTRNERLDRLRQRLRETREATENESNQFPELGLRVRPQPLPLELPPVPELPSVPELPQPVLKPTGNLQARLGFYQTSNIFSSNIDLIDDGLIFSGLRLASVYIPVGSQTYINGLIDGNFIRYINQSTFNYNQVRFDVSLYHQLSPRLYGAIGWSNQQFFYARNSDRFQAGDRFLDENSLRLFLFRRDVLTPALTLNSFYEFKANFSNPDSRSRIINSGLIAFNYNLQQSLQVGFNYQLNLLQFTQQARNDYYHRLFGQVSYKISNSSSLNLQSGWTFGSSTDSNINFDGWFLSINYNLLLFEF
ncbi:hypothetical protein [Anabaena sp. CCY 9613]|uniref:hypothetical protein n=1 Tax=Anabaena sp. CCY 9613 TaxID=3103868 RepID=UPI0039C5DE90